MEGNLTLKREANRRFTPSKQIWPELNRNTVRAINKQVGNFTPQKKDCLLNLHKLKRVRGSWRKIRRSILVGGPGSSGSIVSDYGLDDREIKVRSPAKAKGFFL
jgi:hypothetical protein